VRRRAWDAEVEAFVGAARERPLVWVGDLNVAAAWTDVGPDPEWFRHKNGQEAAAAGDRGQPGFTANEQERFARVLQTGGLGDAYRHQHPDAPWQEAVTWRGTPGVGVPEAGRYYGMGMRIDYALVQAPLLPRVARTAVLGHGADRHGFLGSDHCPLLVQIEPAPTPDAATAGGPAASNDAPAVDEPAAAAGAPAPLA
jgi:AP endonuclease-1